MTTAPKFPRPVPGDCAPYFFTYIDKVPDGDIVALMEQQLQEFGAFISSLTPEQLTYRYAPGKWSLAEMIGHMLDAERVFSYRCFCISRGEEKNLPSFEQDDYVANAQYDIISGAALQGEWHALRTASIALCNHMTAEMAARVGLSNSIATRASAFPYMLVGHVNHHMLIARERYLQPATV